MIDQEKKTLSTMDARTLMNVVLPPVNYLVDGLLSNGLHVLAGNPKVGKSYFTLWLCTRIAQGKPVWDKPTKRCGVLYISLEDTPERIKSRLIQIKEECPENMHLAVNAPKLDEGLIDELKTFLREHPDVGFVAIDTLQKIRPEAPSGQGNPYAADYNALSSLKAVADECRIAMLVVHHLRKARSEDPFQMISGSTGITGAVDTSYVLESKHGDRKSARLYITGRDVQYQEIDLTFIEGVWHLVEWKTQQDIDTDEEIPAFIADLQKLVYDNNGWKGTATQLRFLLQMMSVPVNTMTIVLKRYTAVLESMGIILSFSRTGKNRFIHLDIDPELYRKYLEEQHAYISTMQDAQQQGFELSRQERKLLKDDGGFTPRDDYDGSDGPKVIPFRRK